MQAWVKRVLEVCQRSEDLEVTTELIYSTWIDTLLGVGRVDDAIAKAEVGLNRRLM